MSHSKTDAIGFHVVLNTDFETAQARMTEVLKTEGFGVLTEIDVRETLKKKLDVRDNTFAKTEGGTEPIWPLPKIQVHRW